MDSLPNDSSFQAFEAGNITLRFFSHSSHSLLATSERCFERTSKTAGNFRGPITNWYIKRYGHHASVTVLLIQWYQIRTASVNAASPSSYSKGRPVSGLGDSDFRILNAQRSLAISIQSVRSANETPGHTGDRDQETRLTK